MDRAAPPRIGVMGGTFDPIHHGHLVAAAELRGALGLDRVLLVPNAAPPHKPGLTVSDAVHRVAMLDLVVAGTPWLAIDAVDLDRGGLSYTVETLRSLAARLTPATLLFLMGEDSLRDLPSWRQPAEIVALAELGVATRPGIAVDLERVYASVPSARGRVHLVQIPEIGISSRALRQRVADGRPIAFQVPLAVERYIQEHGLYRR